MMRLSKLIELLELAADNCGDIDPEVRLMSQPRYPFELSIAGVSLNQLWPTPEHDSADTEAPTVEITPVIFICEGKQLGYGTDKAWDFMIGEEFDHDAKAIQ